MLKFRVMQIEVTTFNYLYKTFDLKVKAEGVRQRKREARAELVVLVLIALLVSDFYPSFFLITIKKHYIYVKLNASQVTVLSAHETSLFTLYLLSFSLVYNDS